MTDRAVKMAMNKLQKLSVGTFGDSMDNDLAIKILEQSTLNCWTDLYPLRAEMPRNRSSGKIDWNNV